MKFIVTVDVVQDPEVTRLTLEQLREHIETYVFAADVLHQVSRLPNDPFHDRGVFEDYVDVHYVDVSVEIVE